MTMALTPEVTAALFQYLQRLGDDQLIIGHRLSEWCGHAPILEEDIALANISLDSIGAAAALLRVAGHIEGKGRDEDALSYFRNPQDFMNCRLVEQPRGDFGLTIVRQFLFDAYAVLLFSELSRSTYDDLAGIAGKTAKEAQYHLRHSREWLVRLGDGTSESHDRVQTALNDLWDFVPELFMPDASEHLLVAAGLAPDSASLLPRWEEIVKPALTEATLRIPEWSSYVITKGTRRILHTEHIGHLLTEMQSVARQHPGASW